MDIARGDIVLCQFYFSDLKESKNRPVLVFRDNLPYDDFIAIPISSQIKSLHQDEIILSGSDFVEGEIPVVSKLMMRKTFVISKGSVLKKYGTINENFYSRIHKGFCKYFHCS